MKVLLLFLVLVIQSVQVFPRDFQKSTNYTLYPNSFAKYHYKLDSKTYLLVFTYPGDKQFYVTYKNLSDETENGYFMFDYSKDGDLLNTVTKSVVSKKENTDHLLIQTLVLNMMALYEKTYTLNYGMFESKIIFDEYYGEKEIHYRFDKWIPIFNLYGVYSASRKEYLLELVDAGLWQDTSNSDILYSDVIPKNPDPYAYTIKAKDPMPITLNGIEFVLDNNWALKPKSISGADSYWLHYKSQRDALIVAFRRNEKKTKQQILDETAWSFLVDNVVPSSMQIYESEKEVTLKYEIVDPATGYSTISRIVYKLHNDRHDILILNAYLSVYESNRDYFESMLYK